mmetsp:Transcript_9667/g.27943  ORF Transcript_9667/g.27943 Transcript_9667/m.27943 type:complete len:267 (-) Transcript_9667:1858-2658(-)|eukprot:scaffold315452_cov27-Tisochrysis_lutea.AAC.6
MACLPSLTHGTEPRTHALEEGQGGNAVPPALPPAPIEDTPVRRQDGHHDGARGTEEGELDCVDALRATHRAHATHHAKAVHVGMPCSVAHFFYGAPLRRVAVQSYSGAHDRESVEPAVGCCMVGLPWGAKQASNRRGHHHRQPAGQLSDRPMQSRRAVYLGAKDRTEGPCALIGQYAIRKHASSVVHISKERLPISSRGHSPNESARLGRHRHVTADGMHAADRTRRHLCQQALPIALAHPLHPAAPRGEHKPSHVVTCGEQPRGH